MFGASLNKRQARNQVLELGGVNYIFRGTRFFLSYVWNKFFWAEQNVDGPKKAEGHCPRMLPTRGYKLTKRWKRPRSPRRQTFIGDPSFAKRAQRLGRGGGNQSNSPTWNIARIFAITHFVAVIWTCVSFYFRTFFFLSWPTAGEKLFRNSFFRWRCLCSC